MSRRVSLIFMFVVAFAIFGTNKMSAIGVDTLLVRDSSGYTYDALITYSDASQEILLVEEFGSYTVVAPTGLKVVAIKVGTTTIPIDDTSDNYPYVSYGFFYHGNGRYMYWSSYIGGAWFYAN